MRQLPMAMVCLLAATGLTAAQGSLSDDMAALLSFSTTPRSWMARVDPCDADSFDNDNDFDGSRGNWDGVMCCASYTGDMYSVPGCVGGNVRRVTSVHPFFGDISGDIAPLRALTELRRLHLQGKHVYGDVAPLGMLTELRYLNLEDNDVSGNVAPLGVLVNLIDLVLFGTAVYGEATVLRAIPGLNSWRDYETCGAFGPYGGTHCPDGTSPPTSIGQATDMIGSNACACCGNRKVLDPDNGTCIIGASRP